jgi:hypothetical protein
MRGLIRVKLAANLSPEFKICWIDTPAGENCHTACENHFARSDRHQDFRWLPSLAISENDYGRSRDAFRLCRIFRGHWLPYEQALVSLPINKYTSVSEKLTLDTQPNNPLTIAFPGNPALRGFGTACAKT